MENKLKDQGKKIALSITIAILGIVLLQLGLQPTAAAVNQIEAHENLFQTQNYFPLLPFETWSSHSYSDTASIVWGDVDGDGDLDLAVGNDGANHLYLNREGTLETTPSWSSSEENMTFSLAWGDVDGDGDLDLAVGNNGANKVYHNNNGTLESNPSWSSIEEDVTRSVAWGDANGDGNLDLAIGNSQRPNKLHLNLNGSLEISPTWSSNDSDNTYSVAWGDADGDGDLELAAGNNGTVNIQTGLENGVNKVYFNIQGQLESDASWTSSIEDHTFSIAWGDIDQDGNLDLVTSNGSWDFFLGRITDFNRVYSNLDGRWRNINVIEFGSQKDTRSVALGDADGDGDLDIATGIREGSNILYLNENGTIKSESSWVVGRNNDTVSLAWGDVDGDGDLDLATGNLGDLNNIFLNQNGVLETTPTWNSIDNHRSTSTAWGDIDGDGDLDLAVGNNYENKVYFNNNGTLELATWNFADNDPTSSLAWGDIDGDGDLDLAVGNKGEAFPPVGRGITPIKIYFNENGELENNPSWSSADETDTQSIALGDIDGDGDLDLAAGGGNSTFGNGESVRVYINEKGKLETNASWVSQDSFITQSVAWGDIDGDGDLDLATGNFNRPNQLYLNHNGILEVIASWSSGDNDATTSLSWGDVDGDGDLDLAAGNNGSPQKIYLNQNGVLSTEANWSSGDSENTTRIAWGDVDGDGDLDLAAGNYGSQSKVYLNQSSTLQNLAFNVWTSQEAKNTTSIAWGDVDGDGDLDLTLANDGTANQIYYSGVQGGSNLPNKNTKISVNRPITADITSLYVPSQLITDTIIPITFTLENQGGNSIGHLAGEYSLNGGGQWHKAVPTATLNTNLSTGGKIIRKSTIAIPQALPDLMTTTVNLSITETFNIADLDVILSISHTNDSNLVVSLLSPSGTEVKLFSNVGGDGDHFSSTRFSDQAPNEIVNGLAPFMGSYRPEGNLSNFNGESAQGEWKLQIIDENENDIGTLISWHLEFKQSPIEHVFYWDTFASGFFGQSNNVVFRLLTYSQSPSITASPADSYKYFNQASFPIQRPYASAQTYPFRARGTQAQVVQQTITNTVKVRNANIYRISLGSTVGEALSNSKNESYTTDADGFLEGRGELLPGDQIFALLPVTITEDITIPLTAQKAELYYSSMTFEGGSIKAHRVKKPGVQQLTVSESNPLVLFNLDISLEWDARQDKAYVENLRLKLRQSSDLLFDWSNGQMALGKINIYHNRENWDEADVQIFANNQYRPNADIGGIVSEPVTIQTNLETVTETLYLPGKVRMGSGWDRNGAISSDMGDDWTRAFVHELGHYLLFMDDNYFGYENGKLIPIDSCSGVMADPYTSNDVDGYDEFHSAHEWGGVENCGLTASHLETGRSDWETLTHIYPMLSAPPTQTVTSTNSVIGWVSGPDISPLVPTIKEVNAEAATALQNSTFQLYDQDGKPYDANDQSSAFIIRETEAGLTRVIKLGRLYDGQLLARGVQPNDQLCVQNLQLSEFGCKTVQSDADEDFALEVAQVISWKPDMTVRPVSSMTIDIALTLPETENSIFAQLIPAAGNLSPVIELETANKTEFKGRFDLNAYSTSTETVSAENAIVLIWQEDQAGNKTNFTITDYEVGGSPACWRSYFGLKCRRNPSPRRAPVISTDGRASITGQDLAFEQGEFYALQAANNLPELPNWAIPVGNAYRLTKSDKAPDFSNASLQLYYQAQEVPSRANRLTIYAYDEASQSWVAQETAALKGAATSLSSSIPENTEEGLFIILATTVTPSLNKGWNLFAYPDVAAQPVDRALGSLDPAEMGCDTHCYTSVYQFQAGEGWLLFDKTVPPMWAESVNTLQELKPLNSYWIYATQTVSPTINPTQRSVNSVQTFELPPATFYGFVTPDAANGFKPTEDSQVTALVNGAECGTSELFTLDSQLAYRIQVKADNGNGCGAVGKMVTFLVDGKSLQGQAEWKNNQACNRPIMFEAAGQDECQSISSTNFFLPFIGR